MKADGRPDAAAMLATLRERGAGQRDPVRYGFIEALARRTEAQQGTARQLLERKLAQAIETLAARCPEPSATVDDSPKTSPLASPLAGLIVELAQHPLPDSLAPDASAMPSAATVATDAAPMPADSMELKALRYFRDDWARLSVEQQLADALANGPENAGPLNPHRLVLRTLERMHALSPDYLRRFMTYVDALRWLEQADAPTPPGEKAAADGERKRKTERATKR
jgi:hypothetical protein